MARKAQPYGGLPRRHVRRITTYLDYLEETKPCWDRLPRRLRPVPQHMVAGVFSWGRLAHVPEQNRTEAMHTLSRNSTEARLMLRHSHDAEAIRALLRNLASWDYVIPGADPNTWAPLTRKEAIKVLKRRQREEDNLPLSIEEAIKILEPPPFSSEEEAEIRKQRQNQQQNSAAFSAWVSLVCNDPHTAAADLARAGIKDKYMIEALKAGLKVLRKKRVGRLWDLNPHKSFAAIGITSTKRGANEQRTPE
jgi:hypothetical protein